MFLSSMGYSKRSSLLRSFPKLLRAADVFMSNKVLQSVVYHSWTLALFTWSDIKTTLIPVSVFGLGTAPVCPSTPISSSLKAVLWLWSILLQFNLNNQTASPGEDAKNKPWRPIPSGRISLRNAIILRWISVAYCCILSLYLRTTTLIPSILFTCLVVLYNFFGWDENGFIKNLMNGFGYSAMALGTVLAAECSSPSESITEVFNFAKYTELIVFFLILVTTIHAQDFQDIEGDRETGRNTLPMMFPVLSRVTMLLFLPLWTTLVANFCNPPIWLGTLYLALSLIVGVRFFVYRRSQDDEWTYFAYNIWLSFTILHLCLYKTQRHEYI
ncbi:hypothetical protein H1R20_g9331, partial [Candolleomyces eurysporus]